MQNDKDRSLLQEREEQPLSTEERDLVDTAYRLLESFNQKEYKVIA